MATVSIRRRTEKRIPVRMFVRLSVPDDRNFEVAQTVDISRHGARVLSKHYWELNQNLVLRSIRGNFSSYARVVHCEFLSDHSYRLGLQLYNPTGSWPARIHPAPPTPFD